MPAPGEQHLQSGGRTISNPFEEVKPRISEYTAQEIATLQSKLEKQLGPEYLSSRAGPSGQKVHYVAAEKCIQLANEIFGFNGWSSQIMDVQVDFVDENPNTLKVSLGLSVIVRVTLKDGTFHEDVGYGHMENAKGKAAAFEKAKKEGTTDALKRALRNFGNVLGNCIYDKDYLSKVTKIKAPQTKWDVDRLHRHSDFAPVVKKEESRGFDNKSTLTIGAASLSTEESMDDEFGEFDEADFGVADPDSHPDEVILPAPTVKSNHFHNRSNAGSGPPQNQNRNPNRGLQNPPPQWPNNPQQQPNNVSNPQTPNSGFQRSHMPAPERPMPPPQNLHQPSRNQNTTAAGPPPVIAGRTLNQPSRTGPPSAPASPARVGPEKDDISSFGLPPTGAGFFSARITTMLPVDDGAADTTGAPARLPTNLPAFDPHTESPSIRKTPGVDHRVSKPLARDGKHVPSSSQVAGSVIGGTAPTGRGFGSGVLDGHRRIGAPNSPSPLAPNKSSYKPPTMMKRNADGHALNRAPLVDLPANGAITPGVADGGGDAKRQRLSGQS